MEARSGCRTEIFILEVRGDTFIFALNSGRHVTLFFKTILAGISFHIFQPMTNLLQEFARAPCICLLHAI